MHLFCQLDQVKRILDIIAAVKVAMQQNWTAGLPDMQGYSLRAASAACGLLLLEDYDVFIKQGSGYYWVEMYLDGAEFVIMAVQAEDSDQKLPDILFMPGEEASTEYGLPGGTIYDWRRDDCEENIWLAALDMLNINKSAPEVLDEVENSW